MRTQPGDGPAQSRHMPDQGRQMLLIFIAVLMAAGVAFGVFISRSLTLEQQDNLAADLARYALVHEAGQYPDGGELLRERALFHAKWLLLIWLLGLTVVGMPFVLALDFIKGVLIGFTLGVLIQAYGWQGFLFALAAIAPGSLLILPALIIVSASAAAFTLHVIKYRLLQPAGSLKEPFLAHTIAALTMLAALWGGALTEAFITPHLIGWAAPMLIP